MSCRWLLAASLLVPAFVLSAGPLVAAAEPLRRVRIDAPDAPSVAADLEAAGLDVLHGSITASGFELVVSIEELDLLRARGFDPEIVAVGRPFREIQAEAQRGLAVPPGYLDLSEILNEMSAVAAAHPAICQLVDLTTDYGTPATVEGRHLYALKISDNVSQVEDEPAFLMVGDHHAREIVTPVICLHAIGELTSGYGANETITAIVDGYELWIAPVWNPDGYEYVFNVDNWWRKNRRIFPTGVGVDINRNYPFGWSNACSGSTLPSSETYKGPSPASESETQTMIAFGTDRRFGKVLDYHSFGREVLHGYACWGHPFDAFLEQQASALASASGYPGSIRPPSADGEHYEWELAAGGALGFLIETAEDFQPTYATALAEAEMLWPGALWMLNRGIPVWGHVTDVLTGEPLEATIGVDGVVFPNGEINTSFGPFGRYHVFLPAGTHDLVFEAPGYTPATIAGIVVTTTSSTHIEVHLSPTGVPVPPGDDVVSGGAGDAIVSVSSGAHPALRYRIGRATPATVRVFDVRGALVRSLVDRRHVPGQYEVIWNGRDDRDRGIAPGMYYFRLQTSTLSAGRGILVIQ